MYSYIGLGIRNLATVCQLAVAEGQKAIIASTDKLREQYAYLDNYHQNRFCCCNIMLCICASIQDFKML